MLRFSLFGMEVRVDFLFVALITVFLLTDKSGLSLIGLLACILHELAHLTAFFLLGFTPSLLAFEATGVRLQKPHCLLPVGREVLVLIAGSGINIIIFGLLFSSALSRSGVPFTELLADSNSTYNNVGLLLAISHLFVGLYNLLPLKGLDGGKLLFILMRRFSPDRVATRLCSVVDLSVLLILIAGGLLVILKSGASFTLLVFLGTLIFTAITRAFSK